MCMCIYVYTHMYMYVCACVHVHVYVYVYTQTQACDLLTLNYLLIIWHDGNLPGQKSTTLMLIFNPTCE